MNVRLLAACEEAKRQKRPETTSEASSRAFFRVAFASPNAIFLKTVAENLQMHDRIYLEVAQTLDA